jgi:hypothetical protein
LVENISYRDLTMKNVDPAILFTCYYANNSSKDVAAPAAPAASGGPAAGGNIPVYRNIRISNLTATCEKSAGEILGLPESRIADVVFDHVQISAATGLTIRNATGIVFQNSSVTAKTGAVYSAENAEVKGLSRAN